MNADDARRLTKILPRRRRRAAEREREEERLKETNQTGLTVTINSTTAMRFNPPYRNFISFILGMAGM